MRSIDRNWEILFEKYKIENQVKKNGLFYISADQIREFKEPRLMTKFDTRESLPLVFGNKLAILPVTRGKYVIGEFDLYQDFPEMQSNIKQIKTAQIPPFFETIHRNYIRSEANAINVMGITKILDDFLEEQDLVQTVSGRMGSGSFNFFVNDCAQRLQHKIEVQNSQIEIDGGFENKNIFTLIEAKNVVHSNFLVRQLYYPIRQWELQIHKPIRSVFMVYSNHIFRLLEYTFTDLYHYNSLQLVRECNYSLEDTTISMNDLVDVFRTVRVQPEPHVAFIQADSFYKVISLIESLQEGSMSTGEIAELFGFKLRQSDYYFNACKYLGLAEKQSIDGKIRVVITELGRRVLKMNYKAKQLEFVRLILQHRIFYDLFQFILKSGKPLEKGLIEEKMRDLHVCGESLIQRRSSSVRGWLQWILQLAKTNKKVDK